VKKVIFKKLVRRTIIHIWGSYKDPSIYCYAFKRSNQLNWIIENKEWLFSGLAVALPLAVIGWIVGSKKIKQKQKAGDNSTNIQVGGSININSRGTDD